jgi:two-component system response regulator LytT
LNSIDYLLKPIDEVELEVSISKFAVHFQKSKEGIFTSQMDFEKIKKMFQNSFDQDFKKRFTVKIGQHLKVISTDEIECFFSENKGTYIHTFDNRNYLIDSTLELLEQELDTKDFYRISRKFIIPMKAIKKIVVYSNSRLRVVLPTFKEEEVIVSREKVADFKNWIG